MKTLKILKLSIIFLALFIVTSCSNDDDNTTPQPQTIADLAIATESLSSLEAALIRANLVATLDGGGQYTVFAPTNTAFSTFLAANSFASVDDVPVDVLTQVLLNHVIVGKLTSADLTTGYQNTLATYGTTDLNLSMFVDVTSGVKLNGVSSVDLNSANINASNGVIHVVDAVIGIPTITTFATADPSFSTLATALTSLTPGTPFADVLARTAGGNGDNLNPPFTVFAPVNTAFDAITVPEEPVLTQVLLHHVVGGANIQSRDLNANGDTKAGTLQGQELIITLPGTNGNIADVTDGAGNDDIGIVAVNVQAGNGVIHAINKVALPEEK